MSEKLNERIAQLIAHRGCCSSEHDPSQGKIHGYCVVCGVPWPCEYAGKPPSAVVWKYKDFEDFLQEQHIKEHPEILDDDLPDAFSDWIAELDSDEWLRYGEMYAKVTRPAVGLDVEKVARLLWERYCPNYTGELRAWEKVDDKEKSRWKDQAVQLISAFERGELSKEGER